MKNTKTIQIFFLITFILSSSLLADSKNNDIYLRARILGGLEVEPQVLKDNKIPESFYKNYQNSNDKTWKDFNDRLLNEERKWQSEEVDDLKSQTVFYPFSGPDIINAVTLFPNSSEYIMVGLEEVGEIPEFKNKSTSFIKTGLQKLEKSLFTLIQKNFFYTNNMKEEIGTHSFNGIAGIIMHFLSRGDYDVFDAELISLDASGNEVPVDKNGKYLNPLIKGVKISFKKHGSTWGDMKSVYYFQINAMDTELARTPGFFKFMLKRDDLGTMLKASSYLMFNVRFDDMRSFILARSKYILQGASGIPYRFFRNSPDWDIKLYGTYIKPVPLFVKRCQPDLTEDSPKLKSGSLSFHYDYFYPEKESFILVARRKKDIGNPVFDKSTEVGTEVYCP